MNVSCSIISTIWVSCRVLLWISLLLLASVVHLVLLVLTSSVLGIKWVNLIIIGRVGLILLILSRCHHWILVLLLLRLWVSTHLHLHLWLLYHLLLLVNWLLLNLLYNLLLDNRHLLLLYLLWSLCKRWKNFRHFLGSWGARPNALD